MDTTVWGPLFWALAFDVTKFCDPLDPAVDAYFRSWRLVLPCIHCRRSYRSFYDESPPPVGKRRATEANLETRQTALHAWLCNLKSRVNGKLNRQLGLPASTNDLPLAKANLRREIWAYHASEGWFWDHWYLLACNYPIDAAHPQNAVEREKLPGYAVYSTALVALARNLPYAQAAAESLAKIVWSRALQGRTPLLHALREAALRTGYETRTASAIEQLYSRCDPSRN